MLLLLSVHSGGACTALEIGVFKLSVHCCAHAVGWDCGSFRLHVALLCVLLVVVGLMTRCATQVVLCMHGHLGMLMGNPWCHARCGILVLVLVHGVSHASICRQDTHTTWLHSHCLIALRSWEAHWGFDALSKLHIQVNPTDWAQVGQESKQVVQVSLHYQACASEMGDVAHTGCPRRPGHNSIEVR